MGALLRTLRTRVRALFRRDTVADEISEELRFHVEQRTSDLERQGLSHDDAQRRARMRFGNLAKLHDESYDIRGGGFLETVWQDARYAIRILRRQPVFTAIAIGTFALGIGATAALFSVIDAALLRPLPFPKPDQLVSVAIQENTTTGTKSGPGASLLDARQWRSLSVLKGIAVWMPGSSLIVDSGELERLVGQSVSEGYFEMFGIAPVVGRTFSEDMTRPEAAQVAMLGYSYWRRRFAADPLVVGRSIRIGRESITIVGVLPEGFERSVDVWLPIRYSPALRGFTASYARLQDGVSLETAQNELTAALERGTPWAAGTSIKLTPLVDDVSRGSKKIVKMLAGGVGLILLIACVNLGGLLLARGSTRAPELAVRTSIGAGRGRLVRQLLTESAVLAAAGTIAGVSLAWLFLDAIVALIPLDLPGSATPSLNWLVIGLTSATAVATALLFGLLPARRLSRAEVTSLAGGGNSRGREPLTKRTGQVLIAIELALAVVLLAGSGLLIRSLDRLLAVDLGFDPGSVIVVRAAPMEPTPESLRAFYGGFLDRLRDLPGVLAAGATDCAPLGPCGYSTNLAPPGGSPRMVDLQYVVPGYFEALGITARAGRLFAPGEQGATSVVLDDLAASQLFPDGRVVGGTIAYGKETFEVVGVVGHVKRQGALREVERANLYRLVPVTHARALEIVLRPTRGGFPGADAIRQAALSAGARVIVERIGSGSELLAENVATPRRRTVLLGILASLGLVLTLVGIASVTAYAVTRRTREIGVRIAFGAAPGSVVWTMMRDAAWPMVLGLVVGLAASFYSTKLVASFLFATTPTDPLTFTSTAILLAVTSAAAAWLPARRAARVDPVLALRAE